MSLHTFTLNATAAEVIKTPYEYYFLYKQFKVDLYITRDLRESSSYMVISL